jgi:hypothetical protein
MQIASFPRNDVRVFRGVQNHYLGLPDQTPHSTYPDSPYITGRLGDRIRSHSKLPKFNSQ